MKTDMDPHMVSLIRDAAKEILGINYTFVDDDLRTLSALAKRACEADMLDGMHPDTRAAIRKHYKIDSRDD